MNILVLAGGVSTERDVSLSSGIQVCTALRKLGHNAVLADAFLGRKEPVTDPLAVFAANEPLPEYSVPEIAPSIPEILALRDPAWPEYLGPGVMALCKAADMVYMGLHGGDGENGRIQALFDLEGIRYTGSGHVGSALAMDKHLAKQLLKEAGLPTPEGILLTCPDVEAAKAYLPCVVKPCSGGSSIGINLAETEEELQTALAEAFACEKEVLIERRIVGREFSVGVLGEEALPPIEILPKGDFYDYAHKYQAGWTKEICPADITAEEDALLRKAALEVFHALHLQVYTRSEFILCDGVAWCLEANTLPGMTPTSLLPQEAAAAGYSYTDLCQRIIDLSMEKYEK